MKIVVILIALLLLAGGGLFGAAMLAPGLLPPAVLELLGQEVPAGDEGDSGNRRPGATTLVELEPISVPIFRKGQVERFLVLHIFIEVEPGPNLETVNAQLPRLVDAYIRYVHALAALDITPGISDRAFLKQRLFAKTGEVLGEGVVVDLLFQNIFERPVQG